MRAARQCVGARPDSESLHRYALAIDLRFATLSVDMPQGAGSVTPPNAASSTITLSYSPHLTLSWGDGLVDGATTSLTQVTLRCLFGSAMTSVELADLSSHVAGATPAGQLVEADPSTFVQLVWAWVPRT